MVSEAYEIGKEESYQSGYEDGKQEIIDNLPAYMNDYFSDKSLTMTACDFYLSSGLTFHKQSKTNTYTFPKDGFWMGKWFFRDTNDYKHTTTHHIDILLYTKDGELKQTLWDSVRTDTGGMTSMMLVPVSAGDYIVMHDYNSPKYVYYSFTSSDGNFLSFD